MAYAWNLIFGMPLRHRFEGLVFGSCFDEAKLKAKRFQLIR